MAGTKLAVDCCHPEFWFFGACRQWLQLRGGVPLLLPSAVRSRKSCARLSLDTSRRLAPLAVSGSRSHCSADVPSAAVAASLMHCSRSALRAGCSSGMLLTCNGAFVLAPAFAWAVRRRCEATAASSSAVAGSNCWISEIRCTILPMSRCASPSGGYLEDMVVRPRCLGSWQAVCQQYVRCRCQHCGWDPLPARHDQLPGSGM